MKEGFPKKAFKVEEDHNRYKCPLKGCNKGDQRDSFDSCCTCLSVVDRIFTRNIFVLFVVFVKYATNAS